MPSKKRNKKQIARSKPVKIERLNNPDNTIQSVESSWSGPLPPPSILEQYDALHEGTANRIIQMAENESAHRHKMEQTALEADIALSQREFDERRLGQIFAFILSSLAIGGGIFLASIGVTGWGAMLSLTGVAALASVFIYNSKSNSGAKKNNGIITA